jgi:5-formyltetrahydrofolate cyclo-ligase
VSLTSDGDPARKAVVRARVRASRSARSEAERAAAAYAVSAALIDGLTDLTGLRTVAAHVPSAEEPGSGRLPGVLGRLGARVLLPVVPPAGRTLSWAEDTGEFAPGRFGLLEPLGPRLGPEALATAEAVVVPAVAVARDGVRLGRGGGYYDVALASVGPGVVVVAVVFDDELVDELPAEPHDRRVGAVVTPSGGWRTVG